MGYFLLQVDGPYVQQWRSPGTKAGRLTRWSEEDAAGEEAAAPQAEEEGAGGLEVPPGLPPPGTAAAAAEAPARSRSKRDQHPTGGPSSTDAVRAPMLLCPKMHIWTFLAGMCGAYGLKLMH